MLHYFLTVAREHSFSAAAEYLHITQPTLSRTIMDLEQGLGAKLMIRSGRKIALTEEGGRRRFSHWCRKQSWSLPPLMK